MKLLTLFAGRRFGYPILGHLPMLTGFDSGCQMLSLSDDYGPIFGLNLAGFRAVIINDYGLQWLTLRDPAMTGRPKVQT